MGGEEYVVNSVSLDGVHTISSMYIYKKEVVPGQSPIYINGVNIDPYLADNFPICDYALKVLDALGITTGAVHSEIKVDSHGPVLIEANCRLCGAMMRQDWEDRFLGHHETDLVLDALLSPRKYLSSNVRILKPVGFGLIAILKMKQDTFVNVNRAKEVFGGLKSYVYDLNPGDGHLYPRTIDLSTTAGFIYLAGDDLQEVMDDFEYIRKVNEETPELIFG